MTKKIVRITPAEKRNAAHSEAEQAATPIPAVVPMERPKKKRVRNYKRHTAKLLSEEFPDIMQTLAKKSKEGSLSHTKYLFEIARVKEDIERQGQVGEPSLAELLLAEVRKRQATTENTPAEGAQERDESDAEIDDTEERGGDCGAKA